MSPRKKLLWLDDDIRFLDSQLEEIRTIYDVDTVLNPDDAWKALLDMKAKGTPYNGMILDILLPYGVSIKEEDADGGLSTGIALVDQLKASELFNDLPIVVFTIRWSTDVDAMAQRYNIHVVRKQDPIAELLESVQTTFR